MSANSNGMLDPGNVQVAQPYILSGKSGALTVPAAGSAVATLQHLGMLSKSVLKETPIRISQIRLKFINTSGATGTVAFEVYKGAVTAQHDTGGAEKTPIPRNSAGYPAITAAETNLYMSDTGAISGGTFVVAGDPVDMAAGGTAATFGVAASVWEPTDKVPITLLAGQGMEVRVTQALSAVGILLVAFDFLR